MFDKLILAAAVTFAINLFAGISVQSTAHQPESTMRSAQSVQPSVRLAKHLADR
ncbi:hypothetical protein ACN4EK_11675 [Pantanalinema rosaneae CENA516]|uniref:hypothetical protein n=1 Tax=Pantanalinema rosaneae TaxID=1620701 RepID=UPI003D6F080C